MTHAARVAERFRTVMTTSAHAPREGDALVVALSGGLDSVALLHLLRFTSALRDFRVHAAHFDHGLRASSTSDADWVRGLCRAWGVDIRVGRWQAPAAGEAAARVARYAFLEEARHALDARLVLTAHHADDQAETVLYRLLRGTGPMGLTGIAEYRAPGVWRPLLGLDRLDIARYARGVGLRWRTDETNADERFARNFLRRRTLPELEAAVAPAARRSLAGLARLAQEDEDAWESLLPGVVAGLNVLREGARILIERGPLASLHPGVRARVLRMLVAELGHRLSRAGTRLAVEFTSSAHSGRQLDLGSDLVLRREFDSLVLGPRVALAVDQPLLIGTSAPGWGSAVIGGRSVRVEWGTEAVVAGSMESFRTEALRFPLRVRGRRPGDRVRLSYGTKKLKQLFLEARVPTRSRDGIPVLVDADENVLWVSGIARSVEASPVALDEVLHIGMGDAGSD